jgi:hypothetical protein
MILECFVVLHRTHQYECYCINEAALLMIMMHAAEPCLHHKALLLQAATEDEVQGILHSRLRYRNSTMVAVVHCAWCKVML